MKISWEVEYGDYDNQEIVKLEYVTEEPVRKQAEWARDKLDTWANLFRVIRTDDDALLVRQRIV